MARGGAARQASRVGRSLVFRFRLTILRFARLL